MVQIVLNVALWLLSTSNVPAVTDELNFKVYFILKELKVKFKQRVWLLVTILESAHLEYLAFSLTYRLE